MFTRNSIIQDLVRALEAHKEEIDRLNKRMEQLECAHTDVKYEHHMPIANLYDESMVKRHGGEYSIFCAQCGKFMGGISKEDKARAELEAAKEAYDRVASDNASRD